MPKELWTEVHNFCMGGSDPIPENRGGLKNSWERREVKGKKEMETYTHLNAEFQRIARRDKKAFLSEQCK